MPETPGFQESAVLTGNRCYPHNWFSNQLLGSRIVNMSVVTTNPICSEYLEDEIAALSLQLDELNYYEETKKAKYSSANIPDLEVAYANYLGEIEAHLAFLKDIKLVYSFASAVDTDAEAIAEIAQGEAHAQEDHRIAVQMSSEDPELEAPPYTEVARTDYIEDEIMQRLATLLSSSDDLYEDPQEEHGPSVKYAKRQAKAFETLASERLQCTACTDQFRWAEITQLECKHQCCSPCIKRIIMRGVIDHDLALIPPRCCGTNIHFAVIFSTLDNREMDDFQNTELEKNTKDKIYCSSSSCGRFIDPARIRAGKATCRRCNFETCSMCKNPSHEDDCPADPDLQATLQLGNQQQWQRCFSCRALVEIEMDCNHMTYVWP